jgi:hypothetical protein
LRAVSEQWTIPRHEIQLMGTIGEGEEGVVYKGQWRMMPVVGLACIADASILDGAQLLLYGRHFIDAAVFDALK